LQPQAGISLRTDKQVALQKFRSSRYVAGTADRRRCSRAPRADARSAATPARLYKTGRHQRCTSAAIDQGSLCAPPSTDSRLMKGHGSGHDLRNLDPKRHCFVATSGATPGQIHVTSKRWQFEPGRTNRINRRPSSRLLPRSRYEKLPPSRSTTPPPGLRRSDWLD